MLHDAGIFAEGSTMAVGGIFIWKLRLPDCGSGLRGGFRWFRRTIYQTAGYDCFAGKLVADVSLALHAACSPAPGQHVHLDAKLVSGYHRPAETRAFDTGEQQQLFVSVSKFGQ